MRIKLLTFIFIVIILLMVGVGYRCYVLQGPGNDEMRETAKGLKARITDRPIRGMILDRNGAALAVTNMVYNVFADPEIIRDNKRVANTLAPIVEIPPHEISKMITKSSSRRYSVIKREISEEEKFHIKQAGLGGIGIETSFKRFYPAGMQCANIVGFTGKEHTGLASLELKFDSILRGDAGAMTFITDSARRPIRLASVAQYATNGTSVMLTIDSTIQDFAYKALERRVREYNAEAGIAIVMQPDTGNVLAMVSLPSFDPTELSGVDPNYMKNRAIIDTYEPGSIFKPIAMSIALDAESLGYNEKIYCEQGMYAGKGFGTIGEYNNRSYGNLSPKEILIHSSNIGMAKIGQKLGKKKLYEGVKLFGFGRRTGIELPGEDAGLLWPVKRWTGYSETRIPFGQEISVTAIQIARAYCILANGGKAVKPRIVKAYISGDGQRIDIKEAALPAGQVVRPEVANWMIREALVSVVKEGTGKPARLDDYEVFGKTGTANIALPGGRGFDERNYVASFVGGAPAEKPQIVVLVSVRRPQRSLGKGYTGGRVSAPVVKEIMSKTLRYLNR